MKDVVIIGNGVAGITAARHIRKRSNCTITVISSESPYFFARTALMYVYMGHLKFENIKPYEDWFWKKNRINLIFDHADQIDVNNREVRLRSGKRIAFGKLILATGSRANRLPAEGQDLPGVQSLYSYHDLLKMEDNTRDVSHAVVVGGGLIGVEMAEMLRSRGIAVTMLVREPAYWNNAIPIQEARMISRHIINHNVDLLHEQEVEAFVPHSRGKVGEVRTKEGVSIRCDFAGVAVGVQPAIDLVAGSTIRTNTGILVNEYLETNVPDIYAIGDCVERSYALENRRNIEQVWYTARMMGEAVAQTVCGERTPYDPGPWFNSAKFFDIEFQTYGSVDSVIKPDQQDFYWEHPTGTKALHVVWQRETDKFIGINAFGLRLRHVMFDRWLREQQSVTHVMDHLHEANFDPEWSERYEDGIRALFAKERQMKENHV